MCQPVRRSRGAGAVVAVIEMMNKIGGEPFDMEDEHIIAAASQHVAEALAERFKELETCAETFAGKKFYFVFIGICTYLFLIINEQQLLLLSVERIAVL